MAIDIISLIIACGAVVVSILGYIRHSECLGCIKIDTRTPKPSAPTTPSINDNLKTPLMTKSSDPINIPAKIEPKKIYL